MLILFRSLQVVIRQRIYDMLNRNHWSILRSKLFSYIKAKQKCLTHNANQIWAGHLNHKPK